MRTSRGTLGAAFSLAGLVAFGVAAGTAAAASGEVDLKEVERTLPSFELEALDGEAWTPDSLAGKPWIVNFWASWCSPCIEEMPALNRAWEALEDEGVGMVAINAGEGGEVVEGFLEKVPVDFPVLLGDGATTLPEWSVQALPTTLLVAADGTVLYEALGPRDWDDPALLDAVRALR